MLRLVSATFFRQVFAGILQIITLVIIARVLSVSEMGQYTILILIPMLLSQILTLGIQSANIYGIGRKLINESQVLYINLILLFLVSSVGTIVTIIFLLCFSTKFFPGIPSDLLLLSTLAIMPLTFVTVLPSILQAIQKFVLFNIICIIQPLILLISIVLSIILVQSIYFIFYAYITASFITFFILVGLLVKKIKPKKYSIKLFYKKFFSYSIQSHLSNIVTLLNYRSSLLIIGYFTSPISVGIYSVGLQLVEKLWLPSQAASTIILPKITNLINNHEKEVAEITIDTARIVFIVTLIISVVFIGVLPFAINLLFGIQYKESIIIALILLPGILAWTPSRILANDIAARGLADVNLKNALYVLTLNIVLSLILVPKFGIIGAGVATTIAYSFDLFLRLYAYKKITNINVGMKLIPRKSDYFLIISTLKGLRNV
jgi:O-antigen/teichoic acid export membrane protein